MPVSYEWDDLRRVGSSRLVQLTIVVPVVGYFLLLSESLTEYYVLLFEEEPSLGRLYLLYFGFCTLAVASLLFNWFCPSEIKQHGSAYDFVEKQKPIMHERREEAMVKLILTDYLSSKHPERKLDDVLDAREETADAETMQIRDGILTVQGQQQEQGTHGIMRDYFVLLKRRRPRWRFCILCLYVLGFALVAVPSAATFAAVVWHLLS